MDDLRRRLLAAAGLFAASPLTAACGHLWPRKREPDVPPEARPPGGAVAAASLIDAHCHLFNVTDLPAAKFVRIVFLEGYDAQPPPWSKSILNDMRDPTLRDRLIHWAISVAALGTPSAQREIDRFDRQGGVPDDPSVVTLEGSQAFVAEQLSQRLSEESFYQDETDRALNLAILEAAGRAPLVLAPLSTNTATQIANITIQADTDIGTFLRWVGTLRLYRGELAKILARDHLASTGRTARLLTPAMVDYSLWLGEALSPSSSFAKQVEVMGRVSAAADGPPVHGYVSFDPLRAVVHARGRAPDPDDGRWNPLELVRTATEQHGFLGVKLYPPMGFRASGNDADITTSTAVWTLVGANGSVRADRQAFADDLNAALEGLYDHCEQAGIPIMAHGGHGNQASPKAGLRADPTYWTPVFRSHPRLRVMLAHFGVFGFRAGDAENEVEDPTLPFAQTWEGHFGQYVAEHPDSFAFADISYRSNIFDPVKRRRCAEGIRHHVAHYDPEARHLVFGSDWVMLGIEKGYSGYTGKIVEFLTTDCLLPPEAVDRILFGNAVRFLGLAAGDRSRGRLKTFWARHGLPADRIPPLQAV